MNGLNLLIQTLLIALTFFAATSCRKFEADIIIANYGFSLPNSCESDSRKLLVLESEVEEYGMILSDMGYMGEWNGLLVSLVEHHFLWGDYSSCVRLGDLYSRERDTAHFVEYRVARFLLEDSAGLIQKGNDEMDAFNWGASDLADNPFLGFENLTNILEFREWAGDENGLDALIVLGARLQKGETELFTQEAIIETLSGLLTRGELLDQFFQLANESAPWAWIRWLQASVLFERYAHQKDDPELVLELRTARKYIAKKMTGTEFEESWASCVLNDSGVFEETLLSKIN